MINWQLSKQGISWPVPLDRIVGSGVHPSRSSVFLKLSPDKWLVFKWSQAQVQFHMKYVVFMCCTIKILISNWPWMWKFSQILQAGKTVAFVYFDSWSWQSFVLTCDAFKCLFPLDLQNEIQLLLEGFCYSWLVCLFGFWLRNMSLVKVRNPISDGIVFIFHLAWCIRGLKSLKWYCWPYLKPFRSCISNGKPE